MNPKQTSNVTTMYLIPIAWIYVTLMMAVAEATNTNGTLLGALVTFVLYGLLPVGLVLYFMATPARRRARQAAEALEAQKAGAPAEFAPAIEPAPLPHSNQPDEGSLASADPVASVRKVP
jgi:hypothetical protein